MNEILVSIGNLMGKYIFISPLFAILAGILTSFLPCSLGMLPIVIGYLSGEKADRKRSLWIALFYSLGSILVFTIFGLMAALFGKILNQYSKTFQVIVGILLILMAIQTWNIIIFIQPKTFRKSVKRGLLGAFIAGIIQAIFASPCSTPVLVSLFGIAANANNLLLSILLFISYGIGNSFLIFCVAIFMGTVSEIIQTKKYQKASSIIQNILGVVLFLLGLVLIYTAIL